LRAPAFTFELISWSKVGYPEVFALFFNLVEHRIALLFRKRQLCTMWKCLVLFNSCCSGSLEWTSSLFWTCYKHPREISRNLKVRSIPRLLHLRSSIHRESNRVAGLSQVAW